MIDGFLLGVRGNAGVVVAALGGLLLLVHVFDQGTEFEKVYCGVAGAVSLALVVIVWVDPLAFRSVPGTTFSHLDQSWGVLVTALGGVVATGGAIAFSRI